MSFCFGILCQALWLIYFQGLFVYILNLANGLTIGMHFIASMTAFFPLFSSPSNPSIYHLFYPHLARRFHRRNQRSLRFNPLPTSLNLDKPGLTHSGNRLKSRFLRSSSKGKITLSSTTVNLPGLVLRSSIPAHINTCLPIRIASGNSRFSLRLPNPLIPVRAVGTDNRILTKLHGHHAGSLSIELLDLRVRAVSHDDMVI